MQEKCWKHEQLGSSLALGDVETREICGMTPGRSNAMCVLLERMTISLHGTIKTE
jgi:hypothetical protein